MPNPTAKRIQPIYFLVIFLVLLAIGAAFVAKYYLRIQIPLFPETGTVVNTPFLSTSGTKIYLNGEVYQFTGVNAFHITTIHGTNSGCGGQENNLDAFFSQLRPNSTVRTWAFQGGMATNVNTKKTDWTALDRVVAAAAKNNIKLILTLGEQSGTCDDGHWKGKSWYTDGFRQAFNDDGRGYAPIPYLDYVKMVVARYKDSTAIGMWEPVNEPEAAECTSGKGSACYSHLACPNEAQAAQAMRSFFDTVGGAIKAIDKNHIISSGVIGDGQCGAVWEDYKMIHQSPGIDVASYHDYGRDDQPMPGDQWNGLQKRINQAKEIDKPIVIGEAGMLAKDGQSTCINYSTRRDRFKAKMDAQFAAGISGYVPWDLTGSTAGFCNYDIVPNDPLLTLLREYPASMGTGSPQPTTPPATTAPTTAPTASTVPSNAPSTAPTASQAPAASPSPTTTPVPGSSPTPTPSPKPQTGTDTQAPSVPVSFSAVFPTAVTFSWQASSDNVAVARYDIFRDNAYFTSTTNTSITINGLTPGTTYTFFIKGKDAAQNNSGQSSNITITTPVIK